MSYPPVPGANWNYLRSYYVLKPSGDSTGVTDASRILGVRESLPSTGGVIRLDSGNWYLVPGAIDIMLNNSESVVVETNPATVINAVAGTAGSVIRMHNPNNQTTGLFSSHSGVTGGGIIDGANATGTCDALRIGDISAPQVDIVVRNFAGSGSIALHGYNDASSCEGGTLKVLSYNCAKSCVLETGQGYDSFGYSDLNVYAIAATNQQSGLILQNGATFYHGQLIVRGDFPLGVASTTAAVIAMQGVAPVGSGSAGAATALLSNKMDVQAECGGGSGSNAPLTIYMADDTDSFAAGNYGILDFGQGESAFAVANFLYFGQFLFSGQIAGDPNIAPQAQTGGYASWSNTAMPYLYLGLGGLIGSGNVVPTASADFSEFTLSANLTVALGNPDTLNIAQRCTVIIHQAAAGGPYTVTWPHNGSPTLASPTVQWAGGTPPTMSASANAVDMYELQTTDGITWIGRATQNVS